MQKRIKTNYPGVFYYERKRLGSTGIEKVYYIIFKKDGKNQEEWVGRQYADNMTPAKASSIRSQRIEGKRLSRKEIKIQKLASKDKEANKWTIERLWNEYKDNNPHLKGIKNYISNYNLYIGPKFGNKETKEILALDVDRLRLNLLKKLSPQTVKHILELLRRLVNYGYEKNLTDKFNFKIKMPKVDNHKTEDLTTEQLNRLLKAIDEDNHPQAGTMMKMVLFTGMRRGELFKLQWNDIDFDKGFIHIKDPKGGLSQKIPLNDSARELLSSYNKTDSPYVFPGRDGSERTSIRKQVNRIKERAKLPKNFRPLHGLRHVYASMLASSGEVDMYTLQKLLTHKDPSMTQRYAHLRDETLKKASNVASDIIKEALNSKKEIKTTNN